jgi:hypothetical protein
VYTKFGTVVAAGAMAEAVVVVELIGAAFAPRAARIAKESAP